jgi:hypothetical protein
VDLHLAGRTIFGWVRCSACAERVNDSAITVRSATGDLIGNGVANKMRPDAKDPLMRGFRITCNEGIPGAAIAFGELVVEARDAAGHTARLPIFKRLRARAFMRILEHAPPADPLFTAGFLGWAAGSRELPLAVVAQLRACRDALLPPREVPPANTVTVANDAAAEAERRFWFRFESIAGDCTLGCVQRRGGAEPISLMRFTGASIEGIQLALRNDFAGVGSPEFTEIKPSHVGEYRWRDVRYHLLAHTWIYEGEIPFQRLFEKQCRKIAYLARNLLDDIIEGEKIFVVYSMQTKTDPVQVRLLHAEMRKRGPAWLVHMRSLEVGNPAIGTAVLGSDGLINAYVGPANMSPEDRQPIWRAACGAAAAIVDASRSATKLAAE